MEAVHDNMNKPTFLCAGVRCGENTLSYDGIGQEEEREALTPARGTVGDPWWSPPLTSASSSRGSSATDTTVDSSNSWSDFDDKEA